MTIELDTPLVPAPAELADVLDKAAEHLDRVGLTKGYLYDGKKAAEGTPLADCPVCAWGAINFAVHGEPRPAAQCGAADYALAQAAGDAVRAQLSIATVLSEWNDAKGRQKRQVVKALRDTATGLRGGEGRA